MRTTYMAKPNEIKRNWYVIDAEGKVLGRLASEVAKILGGKHKPTFTPHLDTGDHVIVINADKVVLTGNKIFTKERITHSGYPGGLKRITYDKLFAQKPTEAVYIAVKGMLPHNRLGRKMLTKLRVYSGSEHPHQAQKPEVWNISN